MHTHRVDVLHIADSDAVACAVPHHLVLNFLPSGDGALHQNLSHAGEPETVFQNFAQLHNVVRYAAAGAAEGIGRAEHHRISDLLREFHAVLDVFHDLGRCHRLSDLLHRFLEEQAVLRFLNGQRVCAEQLYPMAVKKA